jgi:hypothetical protein
MPCSQTRCSSHSTSPQWTWSAGRTYVPVLAYGKWTHFELCFQDLYSYSMERAKGLSVNNIITVWMRSHNTSLQETVYFVGDYFHRLLNRFQSTKAMLPSWGGATDAAVARYIQGLERWIAGNVLWSFDTERYFGRDRALVRQTRLVTLGPH